MASKLMHEMMKFCDSEYLIATLKPVIDLVYAEKKRFEIDPTKLMQGENLEENTRNFAVYAELAFVRVCESQSQCPQLLINVLNVLRELENEKYPNNPDISKETVSSYIIMSPKNRLSQKNHGFHQFWKDFLMKDTEMKWSNFLIQFP
uniref:Ras-GAP domain-containing protein n=1 Tax=Panagrolaimus davidi TaxID=227884 RepID=A0A914QY60_9BILA